MGDMKAVLDFLKDEIGDKENMAVISLEEYLKLVKADPRRALRSIFQLFYDMVKLYVPPSIDEYPDDPESIGYVKYDCSKIFSEGADNPFFPDRLLANRFVRQVDDLKRGSQQNRMHVYEGPPGCGKSTFMNNLLRKFEEYMNTKEGQNFEIMWEIDESLFPSKTGGDCVSYCPQKVEIPCPSHDYPILIIPKNYRAGFIAKLLPEEISRNLLNEKEYEWIFKDEPCTICKSLFFASLSKLGSLEKVLSMIKVRPYKFDRRLGEGISIYNPGDRPMKELFLTNKQIQDKLDQIFGPSVIKYVFSHLAKTNNGIYVLMDIKSHNQDRLLELHNVISEGVHKVSDVEERINSFFLALMNPEDKKAIEDKKMESFQARIQYGTISYVLEPDTEVNIYRSIFGNYIDSLFLPRVLSNFARVIISSRMGEDCKALKEWVKDTSKYGKYVDDYGILLRIEIYSGIIPTWLNEEDKKNFTAQVRRKIIGEGENEGNRGLSGRDSIKLFSDFLSIYAPKTKLINMGHVADFFKNRIGEARRDQHIPKNFIDSLVKWYNYTVLQEMKEALYFYNKDQIREDILHFFCAINHDPGSRVKCQYTGKEIEVTVEFLKMVASYMLGRQMNERDVMKFTQDTQKKYVEIVARDREKPITETDLYQNFFNSYIRNLKDKVLQPFLGNDNFREAIRAFGSKEFDAFDTRLKEHVAYMMNNLVNKFGYTEQGAKEVCLYVLNEKIAETFS